MYCEEETIDDLMNCVFAELLKLPFQLINSKGTTAEIIGNLLVLNNPRARLSRTETKGKAFSAIGELFWYLSKSNGLEFIKYYIPDYDNFKEKDELGNMIIHGGYGTRLFNKQGVDQVENIMNLLRERPNTRRAVIQLFDCKDITSSHLDIPCTCNLQFFIRDEKLNLYVSMRSNDAFKGLPHDIFTFTMIQEIIAKTLNLKLGRYYHAVSSLHLYEYNIDAVNKYLEEGWQSTKLVMPEMPNIDPWKSIKEVLMYESKIRIDPNLNFSDSFLDDYWKDILRLIQIHALLKNSDDIAVKGIMQKIVNRNYIVYINERLKNRNDRKKVI